MSYPENPSEGELYHDESLNTIFRWNGRNWARKVTAAVESYGDELTLDEVRTDATSTDENITYDAQGRLTKISFESHDVEVTYDAQGRVATVKTTTKAEVLRELINGEDGPFIQQKEIVKTKTLGYDTQTGRLNSITVT